MSTQSDKGDNSVKLALGGIMALASKTSGMFKSSNIEEKRHVLGLVFSNLSLEGSTLRYSLRKPFDTFEKISGCPEWRALLDAIRTDFRQDVVSLYSLFPPEMREWLGAVVSEAEAQAKDSAHKRMAA